jgi:predicted dehydrogenase
MLTVPFGHFLAVLKYVLGTFKEVSALGTIRIPTAHIIDLSTGQPLPNTDPITNKTAHDQVAISGILKGRVPELDGIFTNIHYQGGVNVAEPFRWVIYGEEGTIEIKSTQGAPGDAIATHEKDVYLNGKKVDLGETELDKKLGPTGKAWLELTKGEEKGLYETLDSAADIYRVVDAALISIREGKKVIL